MYRDQTSFCRPRGRLSTVAVTRHHFEPAIVLFASAMLCALGGCGPAQPAPVSGTVTVGGARVGPGTIIFVPSEDSASTDSAMGHFGVDGRYQLSTSRPSDGAIPGTYRVIVQARADTESEYGDESVAEQSAIPLLYADAKKGKLTAEVQPGANTIDFDLKRRP